MLTSDFDSLASYRACRKHSCSHDWHLLCEQSKKSQSRKSMRDGTGEVQNEMHGFKKRGIAGSGEEAPGPGEPERAFREG